MKTLALLLITVALVRRCEPANNTNGNSIMNSASKSDAITIVEEYIRNRKGWTPQQFRIEEKGREGNYMVYLVIFLPEQNEPRIGGGKTFEAIYDPVVRKVVKEMHFQ